MDSNRELVKDLDVRTTQLSDLLGRFKDRSVEDHREEFLGHLTELQRSSSDQLRHAPFIDVHHAANSKRCETK